MNMKKKDTIKKRVTSRIKGLGALVLALFLVMTAMPFIPSMGSKAATGDQYWIIVNRAYSDIFFGSGQESDEISGAVYDILSSGNTYDNGYVKEYSGGVIRSNNSPLTSLGSISKSGGEIIIKPETDTYVNAGCVHGNASSGALVQMKLDGTVMAETTGRGQDNSANFVLESGKYTVSCSSNGFSQEAYSDGSYYKFIIEFETVIESISITPATVTLTIGDAPQTLTVSPAAAADKVVWSSTDTGIATVDDTGKVTPVSAGTATIKATYTPDEGDPIVGTCEVTVNKVENAVTKVPVAKTLTYTGSAQELVTAGEADGGTMQYALGTKDVATEEYKASIPTGTNAGTYYIWYKVDGDDNHYDTEPLCVTSTIVNSYTVTFKVVNGSWDDETKTDKTVTLTGIETLKLTAVQIPAVGKNPDDGYKEGSWDVLPSTDKAIETATTYTYTYAKEDVQVVEPVEPAEPVETVDMYRIYNPNSGEHFYTANVAEKDKLVKLGWRYEGIGWKAPVKSNTPVYRLYNKNAGAHHYTLSIKERDNLVSLGWIYEGIGWYSDDAETVPLYRQYNPNAKSGAHNFTVSKNENDWLVGLGWRYEGVGWYGVK